MKRNGRLRSKRYPKKDELSDPRIVCSIRRGSLYRSTIIFDGGTLAKKNKVVNEI